MGDAKKKTTRSLSPVPSASRGKNKGGSDHGRAKDNKDSRRARSTSNTLKKKKAVVVPPSNYDWGAVNVPEHDDDDKFLAAVKRCIPSEFVLIASQDDVSKAQEDYAAMDHFQLKPPPGKVRWSNSERAGSVATCALLQMMQENPDRWVVATKANTSKSKSKKDTETETETRKPYSTLDIVQEIQRRIRTCTKQDANPTITSSRPLGPPRFNDGEYAPYYVVPPGYSGGKRRALLIACVSGEGGEKDLMGTINDVSNIQNFLQTHCGFLEENMTILKETKSGVPAEQLPTKKNITTAFKRLVEDSQPGDVNFIQFSGHGNRNNNTNNLYILPSDYKHSGYIQDEKILKNLIKAMPRGVYTTMLVDCCYSGTIGDLPYILKPDSTEQAIESDFDTTVTKTKTTTTKRLTTNKPTLQKPHQSIRTFYDTDTREETLAKEAKGDEEYKKLKAARRQKTTWMLFEPTKLLVKKAAKGAKKRIDGIDNAIDSAIESAKKAGKTVTKNLKSLSPMRSKKDNKSILESSSSDGHKHKTNKDDESGRSHQTFDSSTTSSTRSASLDPAKDRNSRKDFVVSHVPAPRTTNMVKANKNTPIVRKTKSYSSERKPKGPPSAGPTDKKPIQKSKSTDGSSPSVPNKSKTGSRLSFRERDGDKSKERL